MVIGRKGEQADWLAIAIVTLHVVVLRLQIDVRRFLASGFEE